MGVSPASARFLAPLSVFLVTAICVLQSGAFDRSSLKHISQTIPAQSEEGRCRQIVDLLVQNSVLLKEPSREGLIVRGELWDKFPQPVKDAVLACAQGPTGASNPDEIKIIRR